MFDDLEDFGDEWGQPPTNRRQPAGKPAGRQASTTAKSLYGTGREQQQQQAQGNSGTGYMGGPEFGPTGMGMGAGEQGGYLQQPGRGSNNDDDLYGGLDFELMVGSGKGFWASVSVQYVMLPHSCDALFLQRGALHPCHHYADTCCVCLSIAARWMGILRSLDKFEPCQSSLDSAYQHQGKLSKSVHCLHMPRSAEERTSVVLMHGLKSFQKRSFVGF